MTPICRKKATEEADMARETDNGIHFETEHGGNLKPLEGFGGCTFCNVKETLT